MVQEKAPMVIVLMNDKSYGVIKNIQDAQYGGRQCYAELHTPDYDLLCKSIALPHARVKDLADLPARLDEALSTDGPFLLEIDMLSIGGFKTSFAGPPTNTVTQIPALGTAK